MSTCPPHPDLPASVMSLVPVCQLGLTDWYVLIVLPGRAITALSRQAGLAAGVTAGLLRSGSSGEEEEEEEG